MQIGLCEFSYQKAVNHLLNNPEAGVDLETFPRRYGQMPRDEPRLSLQVIRSDRILDAGSKKMIFE